MISANQLLEMIEQCDAVRVCFGAGSPAGHMFATIDKAEAEKIIKREAELRDCYRMEIFDAYAKVRSDGTKVVYWG